VWWVMAFIEPLYKIEIVANEHSTSDEKNTMSFLSFVDLIVFTRALSRIFSSCRDLLKLSFNDQSAISQAGLSAVKASFTFDSFISILYKIFNNRWKSRSSKTAISPASQFCKCFHFGKNQPRIINIQVFEQKLLCYFNITFQNLSILLFI
jgi:hypothetical protein